MFPISAERLREVLFYNPETGIFIHRVPRKRINVGEEAGNLSDGYVQIQVDGIRKRAHQWAWLYMTGEWPSHRIDHKDRDRGNNRWSNLRECTQAQNLANQGLRLDNKTKHKGVSSSGDKYRARMRIGGKEVWLGVFETIEEASKVYNDRAIKEWGEFACMNPPH